MKPKNIKEFKQLIERYESITLEEIEEKGVYPGLLTGFGTINNCRLCEKINVYADNCKGCVYYEVTNSKYACNVDRTYETYNAISSAENANDLLQAYRNRAKYMRQILTDLKLD